MRRAQTTLLLAALSLGLVAGCSFVVNLDGLSSEAGGGGGGLVSFTDDELPGEFEAGEMNGVEWAGDHLALGPTKTTGEFLSRRFDAGDPSAAWKTLAWKPLAPCGKPLPDLGKSEVGYAEDNVDMTGNVLLLHFDGEGAISLGQALADSSGRGNDAIAANKGGPPLSFTQGRFGQAINDNSATYAYIDLGKTTDFNFGTEDFTWALWMDATEDCTGNKDYLGGEDGTPDGPHLWLGCADSSVGWVTCPAGPPGGRAAGYFSARHGDASDGGPYCGSTIINDGSWHHLAIVKTGHPKATLALYVDGTREFETQVNFTQPIVFTQGPELAIGAFSKGTYDTSGVFDEYAVFRRSLSAAEIAALYRRGARRLSFQMRTCADEACGAGPAFAGPGGLDATAFFLDPAGALAPLSPAPLEGFPPARFLQYKTIFESDRPGQGPGLAAVTVTALGPR